MGMGKNGHGQKWSWIPPSYIMGSLMTTPTAIRSEWLQHLSPAPPLSVIQWQWRLQVPGHIRWRGGNRISCSNYCCQRYVFEITALNKLQKEFTFQDDKIPVVSRNGWFMHGRNSALQPSLKILDFFRTFSNILIKKITPWWQFNLKAQTNQLGTIHSHTVK